MMNHSLEAYLRRQPLEKLEQFLQQALNNPNGEDYSDAIPLVKKVIQERKEFLGTLD